MDFSSRVVMAYVETYAVQIDLDGACYASGLRGQLSPMGCGFHVLFQLKSSGHMRVMASLCGPHAGVVVSWGRLFTSSMENRSGHLECPSL